MANFELNSSDDTIDIRDAIERFEELDDALDIDASEVMPGTSGELQEMREEHSKLKKLLEELEGNGDDEEWRGDWYPVTLIHESYFEQYMDEMIADCYELPELPSFMTITLNYEALKMDYSDVEIDGVTYFYR